MLSARSAFAMTLRRCLRTAWLPTLAFGLLCWTLTRWLTPQPDLEQTATGAATPWLELPLLAVAAIICATAIAFWPTFAARRPGAGTVHRLQRDALSGCGSVIAGALVAQLLLTLPLTTLLALGLGAPTSASAHLQLTPEQSSVLDVDAPRLRFDLPSKATIDAIELRPMTAPPPGALEPTRLTIRAGDSRLTDTDVTFDRNGQLARLPLEARAVDSIELVHTGGNVPLFFPDGAVIAIEATNRSTVQNGIAAALLMLLPSFVALTVACLCGTTAALPTLMTVTMALLFLGTIGGLGPGGPALLQLMRGQWILADGQFATTAPSLGAGFLAMILAMLLRRRQRA